MKPSATLPFDLLDTYAHLAPDGAATLHTGGAEFWEAIGRRTELHAGRLLMVFRFSGNWPTWERHPAGDEIVCLLSGAMDLILDEPGGNRSLELRERSAVIVPRGVWHTAHVHLPSEALFITPGEGTENRPV